MRDPNLARTTGAAEGETPARVGEGRDAGAGNLHPGTPDRLALGVDDSPLDGRERTGRHKDEEEER